MFPYRWLIGAAVIGVLFGSLLWWNHRAYQAGIAKVKAEDAIVLAAAQAKAEAVTAQLKAKAEEAAHAHDQELADLRDYRSKHPVSLWVRNGTGHSGGVSAGAGADAGNAGSCSSPGDLQPVSAGDHQGRDIGPLLDILAGKADAVSAQLREWQAR